MGQWVCIKLHFWILTFYLRRIIMLPKRIRGKLSEFVVNRVRIRFDFWNFCLSERLRCHRFNLHHPSARVSKKDSPLCYCFAESINRNFRTLSTSQKDFFHVYYLRYNTSILQVGIFSSLNFVHNSFRYTSKVKLITKVDE